MLLFEERILALELLQRGDFTCRPGRRRFRGRGLSADRRTRPPAIFDNMKEWIDSAAATVCT